MNAETVTPLEAVKNLGNISRDIDVAADQLRDADRKSVDASEAFTMAYNKAFVAAEGSVEMRKSLATLATHTERYTAAVAEANVRDWRNRIRVMERRIDVGRSMVGVLRAESNL